MTRKLLLVDFENVQSIDLMKVDASVQIVIFLGAEQKKLPADLVAKSQKLGSRLELKQVEGQGRNALDFHIAYHLGRALEKDPATECVILSKDKGFDPLLKSLEKEGRHCRRIESLADLKKPAAKTRKAPLAPETL